MGSNKFSERRQRLICVFTDWFTTSIAFVAFNIFRFYFLNPGEDLPELVAYLLSGKLILEQIFVPLGMLFVYWLSGYYNRPFERSRLSEMLMTLYSQMFNSLFIYMAALSNDHITHRKDILYVILTLFFLLFIFVYAGRLIITENMISNFRKSKWTFKTVIGGVSDEAFETARHLLGLKTPQGYEIIGFLPLHGEKTEGVEDKLPKGSKLFADIDDLKNEFSERKIDQVIVVPSIKKSSEKNILHLLYRLFPEDVAIKIKPDLLSYITPTIHIDDIYGEPFLDLAKPRVSEFSKNIKRTFDIFVSAVVLILLSPLLLALYLLVRLSSKGPAIYSQERIGYHRKPFRIYKFRSMYQDAESDGPMLSGDSDPRVTPLGRKLRKYRLDELPQFWNVIKGDMSLVGPRPERAYYIDKIVKKAPWYSLVHQVRPGITSWGMVKYGYASTVQEMIERNRFDLVYITNMSIAVDFKIMIHTIKTVAWGEGK